MDPEDRLPCMQVAYPSLSELLLDLCSIDSPSGHEEAFLTLAEQILRSLGFATKYDFHGNLIAFRPSSGVRKLGPLLLSFHADKESNGQPILPELMDGRIVATGGNSLGADNKAAFACFVWALVTNPVAPALEVVLTRNEEIGFVGARALDHTLLLSRWGLNLDGDREGEVVVSSEYWSRIVPTGEWAAPTALRIESQLSADCAISRHRKRTSHDGLAIDVFSASECIDGSIFRAMEAAACGQFRLVRQAPGYRVREDDPLVQVVLRGLAAAGIAPHLKDDLIGTEACIYNSKGIQMVTIGMQIDDVHQPSEAVTVEGLGRFAEGISRILGEVRRIVAPPPSRTAGDRGIGP
jgi:di/tripeptidase